MPLWPEMITSLTSISALLHLHLEGIPIYGLEEYEDMPDSHGLLDYNYPCHAPDLLQLNELRADERRARRSNRRLRRSLCAEWEEFMEQYNEKGYDCWSVKEHVTYLQWKNAKVQEQLQAEEDADDGRDEDLHDWSGEEDDDEKR